MICDRNCDCCVYADCINDEITPEDIRRQDALDQRIILDEKRRNLDGRSLINFKYNHSEKGMERMKRYANSEKGKERNKRYEQTEKARERFRRYYQRKKQRKLLSCVEEVEER